MGKNTLFFLLSAEMINQREIEFFVISARQLVDASTKITFNPLMPAKKSLINFQRGNFLLFLLDFALV